MRHNALSRVSLLRHRLLRGGSVNACELTAAITALANTLACALSADEITLLGIVLTQLGDTLSTIGAARALCGK